MIIPGKKWNRKDILEMKQYYAQSKKGDYDGILLSPDWTMEEMIKELHINNAIVKQESNAWLIFTPRVKANNYYGSSLEEKLKMVYVVKDGNIEKTQSLCHYCKDRLKGVVDVCYYEDSYGHKYKRCNFVLTLPETDIDLSKLKLISNGMLHKHNAFAVYSSLNEVSFNKSVIQRNKEAFKRRGQVSRKTTEKVEKYCGKCIFQCETQLMNSGNVDNKCCITYSQALKRGFFKQMKIHHGTSIYRDGVYFGDEKVNRWGNRIPLTENKWNQPTTKGEQK